LRPEVHSKGTPLTRLAVGGIGNVWLARLRLDWGDGPRLPDTAIQILKYTVCHL